MNLDRRNRKWCGKTGPVATAAMAVLLGLSGCGLGAGGMSVKPTSTVDLSQPVMSLDDGPCAGGRMTVATLAEMQEAWEAGVAVARADAADWQVDATMVEARIGCAFLGTGVVVKGRFYSAVARAFFASYTGETTPIDPGVPEPPGLDPRSLSMPRLAETLRETGVEDTAEIHPTSGINIRYNGTTTRFGPPGAPAEAVIVHVIVVTDSVSRDIFVDTRDWLVIPY